MSYCRWSSDSDVYVYPSSQAIVCCACSLSGRAANFEASSRSEMIWHLQAHEAAGDRVPPHARERLREELHHVGDDYDADKLPGLPGWKKPVKPAKIKGKPSSKTIIKMRHSKKTNNPKRIA